MSSIALPNTKTIIKNILPTGKHIRTLGPVFTYPKKHTRPRRLDFGLYHGKTVLFGNQISFSERKTRRKWQPNVHVVRLYSEAFDQRLRLKATAHALKCIEKKGGLDRYLLETSKEKIDSRFGLWLRKQVIKQMHKVCFHFSLFVCAHVHASVYIYIYMCVCVCVCVCVCMWENED